MKTDRDVTRETLQAATALHRSGDWWRAEELCLRILASEPSNTDARHLLGLTSLAQGQASRAVCELARVAKDNDRSPTVHLHWGLALNAAGQFVQACDRIREAIRLDP